jgi:hypothetical protein
MVINGKHFTKVTDSAAGLADRDCHFVNLSDHRPGRQRLQGLSSGGIVGVVVMGKTKEKGRNLVRLLYGYNKGKCERFRHQERQRWYNQV